jgi:Rho termination factor-like protein
MAHTYYELRQMTVTQLRDLAKELNHEAVQGYSQMNKDHLLPALCRALNIETLEHHTASGVDKPAIKAKIRHLKQERDRALTAHDHVLLKNIRRQMHALNHQIRSHMS